MKKSTPARWLSLLLLLSLCLSLMPTVLAAGEVEQQEPGSDSSKAGGIAVSQTNFPDANFRAWILENADTNKDYSLSAAEIAAVTEIKVNNRGITSLTGIELFTALAELNCNSNLLTKLNVSGNSALKVLNCSDNQLTTLDVSHNPAIYTLGCSMNLLKSLDVSANTALSALACNNNQLTTLDLSRNTKLKFLNCHYNQLTALYLGQNPTLGELTCYNNQLTALDLSQNPGLTILDCSNNQLTALDVRANTALRRLMCYRNHLTALDLSANTALVSDYCAFDGQTTQATMRSGSGYALDFASLVGSGNVGRVTITSPTSGYTYNAGIFTTSTALTSLKYTYDHGFAGGGTMDVTVTLTIPTEPPVISSIANTASGIKLTWGAVSGAAKYAVYRKAAGESKYTRYTVTASTTYTDAKAVNGTYYYYRIWCLDANGKTIGEWSSARGITCSR